MNAKKKEELAQVRDSLKVFMRREAELAQEVGEAPATGIRAKVRERDEDVDLWDRMTPAERTELYQNDKEEWKRILEAKREAGMRKLLRY